MLPTVCYIYTYTLVSNSYLLTQNFTSYGFSHVLLIVIQQNNQMGNSRNIHSSWRLFVPS